MKTARFVLKLVALGLSVAGAVCLVIAFWDKIMDLFDNIADKLEERKSDCLCESDFEDMDIDL